MKTGRLGATPHDGGVTFGVWAPFASSVAVIGDFNNWSHDTAFGLKREESGEWFGFIANAQAGQEYKFIIKNGDQTFVRTDPRALQLTVGESNPIVVDDTDFDWEGDNFSLPEKHELVVYEMHIGTFNRSDPVTTGTFADAIQKLDHLQALGVNLIELMPCSESKIDMWWGYTPDYIYAVEAAYGGRRAFKEFVKAAHKHGIGVMLDVVYNHLTARDGMDMWRFDGWSENDRGGIYFYNDDRAKTPWGETRLDFGRPEVRQYIVDNARMWVQACHVDGLRVDSTVHIRRTSYEDSGYDLPDGFRVLGEITTAVKNIKPNSLLVAEDLSGKTFITDPVGQGGAGFDSQWDVWIGAVLHEVTSDFTPENVTNIANAITNGAYGDPFKRVIFSESHDLDANGGSRLNEAVAPGFADSLFARRRSIIGAALMLTAPGIPMVFQGQEFLESGSFNHWAPLDWQKAVKYHGILQLYTDLIHLRRNTAGQTQGLRGPNVVVLQNDGKVLAYHRWDNGGPKDDTIVVINFVNEQHWDYELAFPRPGTWKVRFNSDWQGYAGDFANTLTPDTQTGGDKKAKVNIGPYSIIILSQD